MTEMSQSGALRLQDRLGYLVLHRDTSFTATFDSVFQAAGIRVIRSAVQAPRMKQWASHCTSSARPFPHAAAHLQVS
jgi:hypothetical protein